MLLSDIHSFFGRTLSHSFHFIYFLYNILTPSNPLFMPWLLIYEKKFPEVKAYDLLNHFLLEVISAYLSPCPISYPDDLVFFFNGMSWIHSSCSFMSFLERFLSFLTQRTTQHASEHGTRNHTTLSALMQTWKHSANLKCNII